MEILTWVVSGTLQHKDNIGTSASISEHTLQLMSARDGIFHAEGNAEKTPLRILQIWIQPNQNGGKALFETAGLTKPGFNLLAAPSGAPLELRQKVWFSVALLNNETHSIEIPSKKLGYALAIGKIQMNGATLNDGDGILLEAGTAEFSGTGQVIVITQDL